MIANHIAYIDPMFTFYDSFPVTVGKAAIGTIPLFGPLIARFTILVDRASKTSNQDTGKILLHAVCILILVCTVKAIQSRSQRAYDGEKNCRQVFLFPEGTTTNGIGLISFKAG